MNREHVIDKLLDSHDATVGGGSASALAAAMAAGMGGMVARLSIAKNLAGKDEEYRRTAERLDMLAQQLSQGVIDDTAAFQRIADAFKLAKTTEEEKTRRSAAINQVAIAAASAPLNNAKLTLEVIQLFDWLTGKHNVNAGSDLLIGRRLLGVALYGFALNIEANLALIKDQQIKQQFKQDVVDLLVAAN